MPIRRATSKDARDIFEACKNVAQALYPEMKMDVEKVSDGVRLAIKDNTHFVWVSEDNEGKFAGALIALSGQNLWAQRKHAHVVFWVCSFRGDGAALLREFRKWVRATRAIRIAGLFPDCDIDERALVLAERIGFKKHGRAFLMLN